MDTFSPTEQNPRTDKNYFHICCSAISRYSLNINSFLYMSPKLPSLQVWQNAEGYYDKFWSHFCSHKTKELVTILRTEYLVSYIRKTGLFDAQPGVHSLQENRLCLPLQWHVKQLRDIMTSRPNLCTHTPLVVVRKHSHNDLAAFNQPWHL
jgi:hypothetical protein